MALLLAAVMFVSGCTTFEYHETSTIGANRMDESEEALIDEDSLLDIGIVLFESGVDITDDASAAYANVRSSEAVWFSSQLKTALDYSNAWGVVRALPNDTMINDVTVQGQIVESNGETVVLTVSVYDASGQEWFVRDYAQRASSYSYHPELDLNRDPFQNLFNRIANDVFDYRASLHPDVLHATRDIAKVRFAQSFAPDTFDEFIQQDDDGIYRLRRTPADNDPMMQRVEKIKARNDLFLDVIQDYYRVFNKNMAVPYEEWRKLTYKEVVYERQLKRQAKQEKIAGIALMVAGVVTTQTTHSNSAYWGGHVGIFSGADLFRRGYLTEIEASMHGESLRELGQSLESQLEPSVIDLQDRSVTLTGTVEDQFKEWRRILAEIFETEIGNQVETFDDAQLDQTQNETDHQEAQDLSLATEGTTPDTQIDAFDQ